MIVNANISREIAEYFAGYDLDEVVNTLLDTYDITNLPPMSKMSPGQRVEKKINITNEYYIQLYNTFGARSKKVSIARLLEYAFNMNILETGKFKIISREAFRADELYRLVDQAYRLLSCARDLTDDTQLIRVTQIVNTYKEQLGAKRALAKGDSNNGKTESTEKA